ncbi:MAG: hypothetical protein AMJ62_00455 [Myxococcales bacterium SG8_38]|nr:MAG: hypothetical protein AMJ62_00455 [Myxococcales bacterium SG8_38]
MAYRWLGALLMSAACLVGCGADEPGDPFCLGSGCGGSGGDGGTGGVGGTGGLGGAGGGGGGSVPACETSLLCQSCPTEGFCDTSEDCSVGSVCIESGCNTLTGAPIGHCVFAGGGACDSTDDCPAERECMDVPVEGKRCVKTTPGCSIRFDCVPGFSCENGSCVDRRVPCDLDSDCPKNHLCLGTTASEFCVRIQVDCAEDFDCFGLAPFCADIDGDGNKECAGEIDPYALSLDTCLNAECSDPSAPVCEAATVGSASECGQYGLCLDDGDCAAGFSCVGLWPDGRKECVPNGGSCSSFVDCGIRQVCASPRDGGAPSCQAGYQE